MYFVQAGKGRTGLMVCAYLVYSGMSAEEALQLYAQRRTTNNEGVSLAMYSKVKVVLLIFYGEIVSWFNLSRLMLTLLGIHILNLSLLV